MEAINEAVGWLNGIVWGVPMLVLILGVGLFLTFSLRAPRRIDHLSEDDGLNAAFTGSRPGPAGFYGDFPRSNGAISASRSSPDDLLPQFGHAVVAARRSSCTSRRML